MSVHIPKNVRISAVSAQRNSLAVIISHSMFLCSFTDFRHRKTHDRTGGTDSGRNTPCDSSRNTPVSGDEEDELPRSNPHNSENYYDRYTDEDLDEKNQMQVPDYSQHQHNMHSHFRSFSHDGHLNHYTIPPTSQLTMNGIRAGTPPNEDEEDISHPGDDEQSPMDSDGTHSFHEEAADYVHQTNYHGIPTAPSALAVSSAEDFVNKNAMSIMHPDDVQKDYLNNAPMMDPSMITEGWYQ
jgi:hypothetical protein